MRFTDCQYPRLAAKHVLERGLRRGEGKTIERAAGARFGGLGRRWHGRGRPSDRRRLNYRRLLWKRLWGLRSGLRRCTAGDDQPGQHPARPRSAHLWIVHPGSEKFPAEKKIALQEGAIDALRDPRRGGIPSCLSPRLHRGGSETKKCGWNSNYIFRSRRGRRLVGKSFWGSSSTPSAVIATTEPRPTDRGRMFQRDQGLLFKSVLAVEI